MPEAVVLFDQIGYRSGDPLPGQTVQQTGFANKGETVDLSDEEYQRLSALGAVGEPGEEAPVGVDPLRSPDFDPAGRPNDEPQTTNEFTDTAYASGGSDQHTAQVQELSGEGEGTTSGTNDRYDSMRKAELVSEAESRGVDNAVNMRVDDLRDELRRLDSEG